MRIKGFEPRIANCGNDGRIMGDELKRVVEKSPADDVHGAYSSQRNSTSPANAKVVDIVERTGEFADRIIRLSFELPNNSAGWEIGKQIVRSGTSIGANVEEAQAGESKADFLHKMKIARKECRETCYFLRRISNASMVSPQRMASIIDESEQLLKILTSIIRNAGG